MIEKYRNITIKALILIPLLVSLFFVDLWVLPQKKKHDEIISYGKISSNNGSNKYNQSKVFVGYKFFTQKGYEFSLQKTYIEENEIIIKYSYIFKNITMVKSKTKDYSGKLISGLNGACFYFTIALTISAIGSLVILRFDKKLSENGFQNIILLNSFLAICVLYILFLYN